MKDRDRQNLNPTPEAVIAMNLWSTHYAAQNGGSMDFWNSRSDADKLRCRELVERILKAARTHKRI